MKKITITLALIGVFFSAHAQWQRNQSFEGGPSTKFMKTADAVFVLSSGGEVYRCPNDSDQWTYKGSITDLNGSYSFGGNAKFFNYNNVLFAHDAVNTKRSTDNGATWKSISTTSFDETLSLELFKGAIYLLKKNNQNSTCEIHKSTDNGASFTKTGNISQLDNYTLYAVNDKLYAYGDTSILVSTDGQNFTNLTKTGLPETTYYNTTNTDPIGDGSNLYTIVYSATANTFDIYKFDGAIWSKASIGLPTGAYLTGLATIAGNLFVSVYDKANNSLGLFKSTNNALSWANTNASGLKIAFANAMISTTTNTIIAGFIDGIYTSKDAGSSWTKNMTGYTASAHANIVKQDSTLFTIESFNGVFSSADGGNSFKSANTGLPNTLNRYNQIFASSDALYTVLNSVAGAFSLYKSIDAGQNWSKANLPTNSSVAVSIGNSGATIFMSGNNSITAAPAFYRSTNQGNTWDDITSGIPQDAQADPFIIAAKGQNLYFHSAENIYHSADNGTSWTIDTTGLNRTDFGYIEYIGLINNEIYTITNNNNGFPNPARLFKRGSSKWEFVNNFDPNQAFYTVNKLIPSGDYLYMLGSNNRIYVSSNNGQNFKEYVNGMSPVAQLSTTDFALTTNGIIATTGYSGVWINQLFTGTTAIEAIQSTNDFSLYPNPATNHLNLSWKTENLKNPSIQIFDLQGRLIKELTLSSTYSSQEVDISDLPAGFYQCRIIGDNQTATMKFSVVR